MKQDLREDNMNKVLHRWIILRKYRKHKLSKAYREFEGMSRERWVSKVN